jgi:hypothetical protein
MNRKYVMGIREQIMALCCTQLMWNSALESAADLAEARERELLAEINEQARLNGMGGEREARLLAQVSKLEKERAQMIAELLNVLRSGGLSISYEIYLIINKYEALK